MKRIINDEIALWPNSIDLSGDVDLFQSYILVCAYADTEKKMNKIIEKINFNHF